MLTPRDNPYIWVTWLTRLLVGENSCEWAAWFRAHYEGYETEPSSLDAAAWQMDHTALVNRIRDRLAMEGRTVLLADQNTFRLRGSTATLGGKPDLGAVSGHTGTIYDAKTGKPSPAHEVQVLIYMYALPRVLPDYRDKRFDGMLVYPDHDERIPGEAVDDRFIGYLGENDPAAGFCHPGQEGA